MKNLFYVGLFALFVSCAPTRFIKPLEYKQHAITGSFGGALTNVPGVAVIPIPHTSLGYGYGLHKNTTVYGSWYTTAAVFGVFQMDAGITQSLWRDSLNRMGITVSPGVNFMVDVFEKNARIWPQLDANYYFDYKKWTKETENGKQEQKTNSFYFGFTNWFELQSTRAHVVTQKNRLIFSPQVGHIFERNKWNFTLEVKLMAPYASNQYIVVDYVSPLGKRGALGTFFGCTYKL
jgi:hypothetical protein